ncbi:MAG: OmpA family protein [Pseudomonadota bacterium]
MRRSEIISLCALAAIGVAALSVGRYAAVKAESEMMVAAQDELDSIGFSDLALEADGHVLAVSGRVRSAAEREAVMDRLAGAQGVETLYDNIVVVAPLVDLRPAIMILHKDDEALTLTGDAPNAEARDLLGARAELANAGLRFSNLMKAQDRRPSETWFTAAEAAIDAVSALRIGRVAVERERIRLTGAVSDPEVAASAEATLRRRLDSSIALEIDINAPPPLLSPYRFAARKTEAQGLRLIACAAPNAAQRSVILGAVIRPGAERDRARPSCALANGAPNEAWAAAVTRALRALDPLQEGEIEISDDRVRITGFTPDGVDVAAARRAAERDWPDLYAVSIDVRETLPVVSPFAMRAVKQPGDAKLSGHAPSLERAEAWAVALDASNALELGRGAPPGWIEAANAGVAELADLQVGTLSLTGREVRLSAPGDASIRAQLRDRLRAALPAGFRLEVREARSPRSMGQAVVAAVDSETLDRSSFGLLARRAADGSVSLGGVVGDLTLRSVVLAYAKAQLGGADLSDAMRLADGAPPAGWQRAVFAGLDALGELESGELAAEPGALYLRGAASSADAVRRALAALEDKTPEEFARFSKLRVAEHLDPAVAALRGAGPPLEAAACAAALNEITQEDPIRFATGSASINRESDTALDALANVLNRCPEKRFEIGGHTDSSGGEADNLALSQRRAAAVRLSLAVRGVARDRLTAEGYGESRPIADNSAAEGRAKNRRIEFKLL